MKPSGSGERALSDLPLRPLPQVGSGLSLASAPRCRFCFLGEEEDEETRHPPPASAAAPGTASAEEDALSDDGTPAEPAHHATALGRGRLISPCRCIGTARFVHRVCLQKWRRMQLNELRSCAVEPPASSARKISFCLICLAPYSLESDEVAEAYHRHLLELSNRQENQSNPPLSTHGVVH